MNCSGCHAALGGGGMGPPLSDDTWIYGGNPAQVFLSIHQGRPNGMPSFGHIGADAIWTLVSYVRSLNEQVQELERSSAADTSLAKRRASSSNAARFRDGELAEALSGRQPRSLDDE